MSPDHTTTRSTVPAPPAIDRRRALGVLGLGGIAVIAGCASDAVDPSATAGTTGSTTGAAETTTGPTDTTTGDTTGTTTGTPAVATPGETGGPFPADGSNDNGNGQVADVLSDARSLRTDIRSDLDGSNTQAGVPFELTMHVVELTGGPVVGAAVYIWHCNKDGVYSGYDSAMLGGDYADRSFLRGVQVTDADGAVTFHTILPGRYQGRAFHIHFEVFADAGHQQLLLTSQMAMDDDAVDRLYAAAGDAYATSLRNDTDNSGDNVFRDGVEHQLLTVTGDVASGLQAGFTAVV